MISIKSKNVIKLKSFFCKYFGINNIKRNKIENNEFYEFVETKLFNDLYKKFFLK